MYSSRDHHLQPSNCSATNSSSPQSEGSSSAAVSGSTAAKPLVSENVLEAGAAVVPKNSGGVILSLLESLGTLAPALSTTYILGAVFLSVLYL